MNRTHDSYHVTIIKEAMLNHYSIQSYGAGHLVTTTLEQVNQIQNRKFNFAQNPYSSIQNALFDERKRSTKQIFIILKIT